MTVTNYLDPLNWDQTPTSAETTSTLGTALEDVRVPPDTNHVSGLQITRMRDLLFRLTEFLKGGLRHRFKTTTTNEFAVGETGLQMTATALQAVFLGGTPQDVLLAGSYSAVKATIADNGVAGDVVFEYLSDALVPYSVHTAAGLVAIGGYDADLTPRLGILAAAVTAGNQALVIVHGIGIPTAIHGLAAGAAADCVMNTTTGRLERGTGAPGEIKVGKVNVNGGVRLWLRSDSNE